MGRRRIRSESGNAVIELAFTLPLLLAVVMGIFDFGFMFQQYEVVTNAAREGARVGILPGYATVDVVNRATQYLSSGGVTVTCASPPCITAVPGTCTVTAGPPAVTVPCLTVTVRDDYTYKWIGPILNLLSGGSSLGTVTLQGVSVMRVES